jgi:CDP-paratose 2-epimerase
MVMHFHRLGWRVHGVDNNMRADFFGVQGDTRWNQQRLVTECDGFIHHERDIRDREGMLALVGQLRPNAVLHAAAQPSHDLAASRPFDDFDVNAVGTLNLLESVRRFCADSPFVYLSTNKVYGDGPNSIQLTELETRWDYNDERYREGIGEDFNIDQSKHSLFGASKVAADVMVQEYGRYFGMPTVCYRGGCLTGPNHSGAELHGFLAYLAKCVRDGRPYRVYGYKGKQVRDNIHSYDVCTAFLAFYENPRVAAVYNLGGGRENSVSILEAVARFEELIGKKLTIQYIDQNRVGDHICYISDLRRLKAEYPGWELTRSLEHILRELAAPPTG